VFAAFILVWVFAAFCTCGEDEKIREKLRLEDVAAEAAAAAAAAEAARLAEVAAAEEAAEAAAAAQAAAAAEAVAAAVAAKAAAAAQAKAAAAEAKAAAALVAVVAVVDMEASETTAPSSSRLPQQETLITMESSQQPLLIQSVGESITIVNETATSFFPSQTSNDVDTVECSADGLLQTQLNTYNSQLATTVDFAQEPQSNLTTNSESVFVSADDVALLDNSLSNTELRDNTISDNIPA
jgi:uncharacterized membrane protein YqiK